MYQREALLTDDQRGLLLDDQPLFHFEPPAPVPARTHVPSVLETSPSDFPKVDELVEVLKGIGAYDERHHGARHLPLRTACSGVTLNGKLTPCLTRPADKYAVLRFLKARNYEVEKARDMWVAMLRWRRENKVDTINSWFSFFEKREFLQLYPQGFHKTDWLVSVRLECAQRPGEEGEEQHGQRAEGFLPGLCGGGTADQHLARAALHSRTGAPPCLTLLRNLCGRRPQGRPVSVQRIGQADLNRLLGLTTEDRMRLFHISEQERLQRVIFPACSAAAGRHVDQVFSIIDMAGVRLRCVWRVPRPYGLA